MAHRVPKETSPPVPQRRRRWRSPDLQEMQRKPAHRPERARSDRATIPNAIQCVPNGRNGTNKIPRAHLPPRSSPTALLPDPMTEAIGNPVHRNARWIPDRTVVGNLFPMTVVIKVVVAGHTCTNVLFRRMKREMEVARFGPFVETRPRRYSNRLISSGRARSAGQPHRRAKSGILEHQLSPVGRRSHLRWCCYRRGPHRRGTCRVRVA